MDKQPTQPDKLTPKRKTGGNMNIEEMKLTDEEILGVIEDTILKPLTQDDLDGKTAPPHFALVKAGAEAQLAKFSTVPLDEKSVDKIASLLYDQFENWGGWNKANEYDKKKFTANAKEIVSQLALYQNAKEIQAVQAETQGLKKEIEAQKAGLFENEVFLKAVSEAEQRGIKTATIAYESTCEALIQTARKEGREEVKTWLLNHMCHIGRSERNYVYLGVEYTKQCKLWDGQSLKSEEDSHDKSS